MPVSARKSRISRSSSRSMRLTISSIADTSSVLYEGRARKGVLPDISGMKDEDWRQRLTAAIKDKGTSMRALSLAAGLGPGYVHGLLKEGKDPTVDNLLKLCDQLGVSIAYILKNVSVNAETEEILGLLQSASPEARSGILALLREKKRA